MRICNFIESELIWSSKRVKSAENVDSWITGIPSLILWPRRSPDRNIAEEKHVLHTCQINIPIAKKIINQKFISVAHLRNNYFVTHIVLLVIHDTMQYFKTNDMCIYSFYLCMTLTSAIPVSLRLRLWRVIQNVHSRYALNQYCNVYFGKIFTRS